MEQLAGGMGNGGTVVRIGDTVVRPAGPHERATVALLRALTATGFPAPVPIGTTGDGRSRFAWIDGDVGVAPFPDWVMTDHALASAGRLLRSYHEAVATLKLPNRLSWSDELADPEGGPIICHNDICPENVVYRDRRAVALLDFDFAAPGRPLWDLAQMARMWSPLRPPELAAPGTNRLDPFHRLSVLTAAYGLPRSDHDEFVEAIVQSGRQADRFLRRRLAAREPAFVRAWTPLGGETALARILLWLHDGQGQMRAALR